MKPQILFFTLLFLHLNHAQEEPTEILFDDDRINYLGSGMDVLTSEARESIFRLISNDSTKPILTATLSKGVVMKNNSIEKFKSHSKIQSQTEAVSDTCEVKVSGGGGFLSVKGSFSCASKVVNSFKSELDTEIVRTYGNVDLDTFDLQTYDLELMDGFHDRIVQISNYLQKIR